VKSAVAYRRCCDAFRMPARTNVAPRTGAGVRKPSQYLPGVCARRSPPMRTMAASRFLPYHHAHRVQRLDILLLGDLQQRFCVNDPVQAASGIEREIAIREISANCTPITLRHRPEAA
jgi:hypothetical protein